MTRSDELLLAFAAFAPLILSWLLMPSGLPKGVSFDATPDDGVPTIAAEEFQRAQQSFLTWARRRWPLLLLPIGAWVIGLRVAGPAVGFGVAGLGFEVFGAYVLAEGLLDLNVIRWLGTWGGLEQRSRQAALDGREKALRGVTLVVVGFILQTTATVLSRPS